MWPWKKGDEIVVEVVALNSLLWSIKRVRVALRGNPELLAAIQFLKENETVETPANVSDSSWDSVKVKRANGDEVPKDRVERIISDPTLRESIDRQDWCQRFDKWSDSVVEYSNKALGTQDSQCKGGKGGEKGKGSNGGKGGKGG